VLKSLVMYLVIDFKKRSNYASRELAR
jgi:hypothetical protein